MRVANDIEHLMNSQATQFAGDKLSAHLPVFVSARFSIIQYTLTHICWVWVCTKSTLIACNARRNGAGVSLFSLSLYLPSPISVS